MSRTTRNSAQAAPHKLTPLKTVSQNDEITLASLSVKLDDILRRLGILITASKKLNMITKR